MKKLYKYRLRKLAEHIVDRSKRGHKKFDFGKVSNGSANTCGTSGCAMGECPVAFPRSFKFDVGGLIRLRKDSEDHMDNDVAKFFGLDLNQVNHLFYPGLQQPFLYGGKTLDISATARQVSKNILAFLEKV